MAAIRIALDGMGGDYAPQNVVSGAVQAVAEYNVHVILVGTEDRLRTEVAKHSVPGGRLEINHAPEVVAMDEPAAVSIRRKRNSSMARSVDLAARGDAQAVVSAGNTGAMYAAVKLSIGTLKGVDRLPLAALCPHPAGKSILLDVGANVDCKPQHLFEFAVMGSIYAEEVLNIRSPRIGLLSIGEEKAKGNELTKSTFPLLKDSELNFIGNVEGNDVFKGTADVIIC